MGLEESVILSPFRHRQRPVEGEKVMERTITKLSRVVVILLCAAVVTTVRSQQKQNLIDVNALGARGEAIASEELRNLKPRGPRKGFDIGIIRPPFPVQSATGVRV